MIVLNDPAEIPEGFGSTVVAIGKFDGVHAGHRALIEKLLVDAASDEARTVAVTFDRHPLATIAPDASPEQVVSIAQKIDLLAASGLDATLVLTFDAALASVPAEEFVLRYLVDGLRARRVLIGEDFRFGHRGAGDATLLRRMGDDHGFTVEVIPPVASRSADVADDRRVSSTWIRELLSVGDVERAAKLLGHDHGVRGEIVHGKRRGRALGFPTANLAPSLDGFVPADGVYAGWLSVRPAEGVLGSGAQHPAAISVGTNPTFDDVPERVVEAHVLDRDDLDLYGRTVDVEFVSRLRGMVAFEGLDDLIAQMRDDVDAARDALRQ
ncbi:riboflavin biosynthesis protein [Microbacterium faecale]|uniref:Riboflavin biosynthesis protein n=1 Tax=Microbacterium faecale TaxID=1804630 RepID=A0A916YGV3_9MICO|nr:bifunctional riboflavin kinase/FAD synthetase [Microbacterium faecale]GGD44021.1 riboflavin biosynthesis protein [Microbacterium faecale]